MWDEEERAYFRNIEYKLGRVHDDMKLIIAAQIQERTALMALKDDLAAAVTGIMAALATEHTAVQAEIAALQAALTNPTADPVLTAAVTAAIANLQTATSTTATDVAALTASLPAPAPAPVPTP